MKLNLDSHAITLTCPGCGKKFDEKIGRLKNNPILACPGCQSPVTIKADELRLGIQAVQKSLDDFARTLSDFGK